MEKILIEKLIDLAYKYGRQSVHDENNETMLAELRAEAKELRDANEKLLIELRSRIAQGPVDSNKTIEREYVAQTKKINALEAALLSKSEELRKANEKIEALLFKYSKETEGPDV